MTGGRPVLELDFSRYGRSDVIEVRLFTDERAGLVPGSVVLLGGDTVDPEPFEVTAISDDGRVFTFRRVALAGQTAARQG